MTAIDRIKLPAFVSFSRGINGTSGTSNMCHIIVPCFQNVTKLTKVYPNSQLTECVPQYPDLKKKLLDTCAPHPQGKPRVRVRPENEQAS